jgi:hypothetical protein
MTPFRASPGITETWQHFDFAVDDGVATLTFNRPDKLNALTFDVYADLRDLLAELPHRGDARVLVVTGAGRGFCSGGDVEEIIGELQRMETAELLEFTRMTGAVVKALRECPLPVIAAINGVAAGAGLGDRAGQRLPPAGAVGVVRVPLHAGRASPAPTWVGLPAAADRRAGPRDRAARARRQGAGRAGRAIGLATQVVDDDELPGAARRSRGGWPTGPRWPTRRRRSCSRASST